MTNCNCGNARAPHKVWCAIRVAQRERRLAAAAKPEMRLTKAQKRIADHDRHVKVWKGIAERVSANLDRSYSVGVRA